MIRCMWIDGQLKDSQKNWTDVQLKDYSVYTATEIEKEEVYNYPSESPHHFHLRKLLSSEIFIPSNIFCGNETLTI